MRNGISLRFVKLGLDVAFLRLLEELRNHELHEKREFVGSDVCRLLVMGLPSPSCQVCVCQAYCIYICYVISSPGVCNL